MEYSKEELTCENSTLVSRYFLKSYIAVSLFHSKRIHELVYSIYLVVDLWLYLHVTAKKA